MTDRGSKRLVVGGLLLACAVAIAGWIVTLVGAECIGAALQVLGTGTLGLIGWIARRRFGASVHLTASILLACMLALLGIQMLGRCFP
jgi:hypothetical protein